MAARATQHRNQVFNVRLDLNAGLTQENKLGVHDGFTIGDFSSSDMVDASSPMTRGDSIYVGPFPCNLDCFQERHLF